MGAAHVGILEVVDRTVGIDVLCGCSAGAISGLVYADGGSEGVQRFLNALDSRGLMGRSVSLLARSPAAVFDALRKALYDVVSARSFAELGCEFSCVATDIVTGETVVLDRGDPVRAVLASSAFPGVFRAQCLSGRTLVDGGVTRNLPAGVVRCRGVEFVIGSSLYHRAVSTDTGRNSRPGRLESALRAFDIMSRELAAVQSRECDYCFYPPMETFRWYDFDHIPEMLALGRGYAEEQVDELLTALRSAESRS